jgi:hypothetical protein
MKTEQTSKVHIRIIQGLVHAVVSAAKVNTQKNHHLKCGTEEHVDQGQ